MRGQFLNECGMGLFMSAVGSFRFVGLSFHLVFRWPCLQTFVCWQLVALRGAPFEDWNSHQ